jgi:hypothetical protein
LVFASGLQWQWHALKRFLYALCEFYILSYSVYISYINEYNAASERGWNTILIKSWMCRMI